MTPPSAESESTDTPPVLGSALPLGIVVSSARGSGVCVSASAIWWVLRFEICFASAMCSGNAVSDASAVASSPTFW